MQISTSKNTAATGELTDGQQYVFRVASRNADGVLVWSQFSDVFTAQNVALGSGGVSWVSPAPNSSLDNGTAGDVSYDGSFFFLHNGTQWNRTQLAAFGLPTLSFASQPSDLTLATSGNGSFSAAAVHSEGLTVGYQWQTSGDNGTTWANVSGGNLSSLTVTTPETSQNGTQYRVIASATAAADITSNIATLTVISDSLLTENADSLLTATGDRIQHDGDQQVWQSVGGNITNLNASGFGRAVAIDDDGDVAVIGAYLDDQGGATANGTVSVHGLTAGTWSQIGSTVAGEADGDRFGSTVAVNSDGTVFAALAEYNSETYSRQGHARVYEWSGTAWQQRGSDIDGDRALSNMNGLALSGTGSRIACGWSDYDSGPIEDGLVRVFDWDGSAWQQAGSDITGTSAGSSAGKVALSTDGTILIVGETEENESVSGNGKCKVYEWVGNTSWQQKGNDIDGDSSGDLLGTSVSCAGDGSRICVGGVGYVRVFDWNGTGWQQVGSDITGNAANLFGTRSRISKDGTRVVICAIAETVNSQANAGAVEVYELQANTWQLVGSRITRGVAGERLGTDVSISSTGGMIAAGTQAEAVHFFSTD